MSTDIPGLSLEANRRKTFVDWPCDVYESKCTSDKLAAAGFFHVRRINEPDCVRCYVCLKELDGWEPEDEPWEEHRKHSPKCPLLKMKKKKEEDWTIGEFLKMNLKRQEVKVRKIGDRIMDDFESKAADVQEKLQAMLDEDDGRS